jgi:Tfp pilus assembly pilus retraction ATPase PilT
VLAAVTENDPTRRQSFDATGELDLAYTPTGLPRFRVNGFRQRGAVSFAFRAILAACRPSSRSGCRPVSPFSPRSTAASCS